MREIGFRGAERPPTHCLGWGLRVFGKQGNDPEPGQARGLHGRRLGGDSLSWGSLTKGAGRLQDRAGRAGRGSRGDRRRPRSGLCSRSRPEPSEPGGAQNGEEGREGQRRGGGTRRPPSPNRAPSLWRPLVETVTVPLRNGCARGFPVLPSNSTPVSLPDMETAIIK